MATELESMSELSNAVTTTSPVVFKLPRFANDAVISLSIILLAAETPMASANALFFGEMATAAEAAPAKAWMEDLSSAATLTLAASMFFFALPPSTSASMVIAILFSVTTPDPPIDSAFSLPP